MKAPVKIEVNNTIVAGGRMGMLLLFVDMEEEAWNMLWEGPCLLRAVLQRTNRYDGENYQTITPLKLEAQEAALISWGTEEEDE